MIDGSKRTMHILGCDLTVGLAWISHRPAFALTIVVTSIYVKYLFIFFLFFSKQIFFNFRTLQIRSANPFLNFLINQARLFQD
jgi:hypothetical protein